MLHEGGHLIAGLNRIRFARCLRVDMLTAEPPPDRAFTARLSRGRAFSSGVAMP
jgi:hypothetical protein